MGSTTAKGYPYPVGTDRVMDGDDAIKALAEKVDTFAGVIAAGSVNLTLANSNTGSVTVTLPAGRFTAQPVVVCSTAFVTVYLCSAGTTTNTSTILSIRHYNDSASSNSVTIKWIARTDG